MSTEASTVEGRLADIASHDPCEIYFVEDDRVPSDGYKLSKNDRGVVIAALRTVEGIKKQWGETVTLSAPTPNLLAAELVRLKSVMDNTADGQPDGLGPSEEALFGYFMRYFGAIISGLRSAKRCAEELQAATARITELQAENLRRESEKERL